MTIPGSDFVLAKSFLHLDFTIYASKLTRNGSLFHTKVYDFTANSKQTLFYCAKPCTSVKP